MFAVVPLACGDDESPKPSPSDGGEPGSGGTSDGRGGGEPVDMGGSDAMGGAPMLPPGISLTPKTEQCSEACTSGSVGLGPTMTYYLDPCCTEEDDACGLNTTFLAAAGVAFAETCQPKNQPGELDDACPSPEPAVVPAGPGMITLDPFPGCCRPSGVCGVVVNEVSAGMMVLPLGNLELGCLDAAPFFPGEEPVPCGDGAGGGNAGGSGNAGEASVGGDGAGGASGGAGG